MDDLDKIFRAYDIRGIYPGEINKELAYKVGRAATKFLILETRDSSFKLRDRRVKNLAVGRDNRVSSPELFAEICDGIRAEGVNVVDIGMVTTPMFYFSVIKMNLDGGIMITASHNPKQYNGFKIVKARAMPFSEEDLNKIKEIIKKSGFKERKKRAFLIGKNILTLDVLKEYVEQIIDFSHLGDIQPMKIVIDTGNGIGRIVVSELSKRLPIKIEHIFSELDGNFPNHDPNPGVAENIKFLQEKVLSEKADLGVAFDGDADRIIFVDGNGKSVDPDLIATLIIHYFFKDAGKILCTVVSSKAVKDEAMDSGNEVILSRIGHTFIRKKMAEEKIVFGCEASGHYYFKDTDYIEAPFLVLMKVLELISRTKMPFLDLINAFQRFYQCREAIPFLNLLRAKSCIKNIEGNYKKIRCYGRIGIFYYIDGLSVEYPDWWFNVRISNTEPLLRLTIEADTKELLEEKKQEMLKLIPSSL